MGEEEGRRSESDEGRGRAKEEEEQEKKLLLFFYFFLPWGVGFTIRVFWGIFGNHYIFT